jgi:hypothetical protein
MTTAIETKTVYQFYTPAANETLVLIENFEGYSYKTYAVYVNGEYDRRINVAKC